MLDPAPLIGFLELEPLGRSECAGRTGIAARARPRPDDRRYGFQLHVLGLGADDYELLVDAERGILLRTVARLDGEDFHVREMAEIAFDEEFPPETFVFVPPPGEEIRPVGTRLPRLQLMIEQAVALAPFPLWIPSRLPPGRWKMEVHHFPGEERPRVTESVWIHYHLEDASHQINLQETAAREAETPEVLDWQVVRHGEDEFLVVEIEHPGGQVAIQVRAERDGTTVTLSSDLERETVLALAESLAPAPAEPPRL